MRRATIYPTMALSCAIAILSTRCASVPAHSADLSLGRAADTSFSSVHAADTSLSPGRTVETNEPARHGRSSDVLTATELLQAHAVTTAAGVRQLRPAFVRGIRSMTASGTLDISPSVYLNGGYLGGLDALESVSLDAVQEIRFIRPAQAHDFWGSWCPCDGGVIHVRTKHSN